MLDIARPSPLNASLRRVTLTSACAMRVKEIGDNIFTKASEGANNLKQTLKEIKPSAGLSDHELSQGINGFFHPACILYRGFTDSIATTLYCFGVVFCVNRHNVVKKSAG